MRGPESATVASTSPFAPYADSPRDTAEHDAQVSSSKQQSLDTRRPHEFNTQTHIELGLLAETGRTWGSISMQHVISLIAVADTSSVSEAAKRLHYSQPAVSRHLKAFEAILGFRLFGRCSSGMKLTPAGERVYVAAVAIYAQLIDKWTYLS